MHEDKQGNLWLVTGGGLVKFVASAEQIQYSSEHIAFNMHFSEGVGATDGKQIFFGTNRGLFYFTPENIHKTDFIPQIFFSSIWVNNQELTPRKLLLFCLLILIIARICSYLLIITPSGWYSLL